MSTIDSKLTVDQNRLSTLPRNIFAHTRRVSEKIRWSANKKVIHPDSTPDSGRDQGDTTKSASNRKSIIKKHAAMKRNKVLQFKTQKEKRFAAYNRRRRISKIDQAVDDTFSIGSAATFNVTDSGSNLTGATYDLDPAETSYESEILDFHAEINEHQGPIEIIVENADDEVIFENLCHAKESQCPFENNEQSKSLSTPWTNDEKASTKSGGEVDACANLSPQSVNSNFSANSTTRMSSHCARLYWNQQKIPKLVTYKAEKKSFDNNSQNSLHSHHSTHSQLMTTVRSLHSNVSIGWNDLPPFIKYYIVSITICFIAILYYQFNY